MKPRNYNLSSLMNMAWSFVKRNGLTMSEALRCAWRNLKLKAQLAVKVCKFTFIKVDDTMGVSYGTLKESLLPRTMGFERPRPDYLQTYYDTEKGEWRSFKKVNLVGID
ncbi:MAG: DUF2693 domain-containing protein [Marinilabiliaceae bacterium]|nr:DUF2693 domain-containing protein [Marinilabiliaceae bacterium]